jgi:hypothetical protein
MGNAALRQRIHWSAIYQPTDDDAPWRYVERGQVGWGRGRRLGRLVLPEHDALAYLGVQHHDPARWGQPDPAVCRFFVSCRSPHEVWLRTFSSVGECLIYLTRALERSSRSP